MDLRSGIPFWAIQSGTLGVYPPLTRDETCEVAVVGGGVTGALVAHRLAAYGWSCVVLDKRDVGWGSTMGSTALLQYEIDTPMVKLGRLIGEADAALAYRLCVQGVATIQRVVGGLDDTCGFMLCRSLFLAKSPDETAELERECKLRRGIGIDVRLVRADELRSRFGIDRPSALQSALAARVEPYRLTHRLLAQAGRWGTRTYDRTAVTGLAPAGQGRWVLHTDRGPRVTAQRVVFATGYESQALLREKIVDLTSTFALATEPVLTTHGASGGLPPWLADHVLWETGDPYFYARSGPDGRLLIGGEDDPFESNAVNQRVLARKTDALIEKARMLFHGVPLEVAHAWSGVFGKTRDGLGYFGQSPELPGVDFVLGFGGNGITFAALMAEMLARQYSGSAAEGAHLFRFGR
jgi:glycine/D-amino acid oxidase-like deaminating enzyme